MHTLPGEYHYHRIGHDEREMVLLADGTIGLGADGAERRWELRESPSDRRLMILGDYGEICELKLESDGCWRGNWLQFEKMPVELVPRRLQPLRSLRSPGVFEYIPHQFNYISYAQLVRDCTAFARKLPGIRAIAGVPRSGMIPASLMALELNVPMIALELLINNPHPEIPLPRRGFHRRIQDGMILVVDDTSASGRQFERLRELISVPVQMAAIYVEERPVIAADLYYAKLPRVAQFFEWTMFHDDNNHHLLTDLDGVLCDDWNGGNEDEHPDAYQDFLHNVRPRRIPSMPLKGIVTNRLERHRPETVAWLRRHGIQFGTLTMSPHTTFSSRDQAQDASARKAAAYAADPALRLFVESDDQQAVEIARRTGRPVFSMARNDLV
ncbi:MAG: hypothetical protein WCJ09_13005 [Planctomycetota bacterium]